MSTLRDLVSVSDSQLKNSMYELLLYSFPEPKFWDKIAEMEAVFAVPVGEFVRDDLWLKGIVENRGEHRMGSKMRKLIKDFLLDSPVLLDESVVKKHSLRDRQTNGLAKLQEYGDKHKWIILFYEEGEALVMYSKCKRGVLLNAGRSFAYLYKAGGSFNIDKNMPVVGYFQLCASDVVGKLKEALNGQMKERTAALAERRKQFIIRRKNRWRHFNEKRSAVEKLVVLSD